MSIMEIKREHSTDDEPFSIKGIFELSEAVHQENIELLREGVQTNMLILDHLKYNRQVYTKLFEKFSKSSIIISNMLERIARRKFVECTTNDLSFEKDVSDCFAEIEKVIDISNEYIKVKITDLSNPQISPLENPNSIALDPISHCESTSDKQSIMRKLDLLAELRSQISERRAGASYLRDMHMVDLKKIAEKYFI